MSKKYSIVEFDCHHTREFEIRHVPPKGEIMYCLRCDDRVQVIRVVAEYRIECDECRLSRGFGAARLQAEIKGARHHNRKPWHQVRVTCNGDTIHIFKAEPDGLFTRFGKRGTTDVELPPF